MFSVCVSLTLCIFISTSSCISGWHQRIHRSIDIQGWLKDALCRSNTWYAAPDSKQDRSCRDRENEQLPVLYWRLLSGFQVAIKIGQQSHLRSHYRICIPSRILENNRRFDMGLPLNFCTLYRVYSAKVVHKLSVKSAFVVSKGSTNQLHYDYHVDGVFEMDKYHSNALSASQNRVDLRNQGFYLTKALQELSCGTVVIHSVVPYSGATDNNFGSFHRPWRGHLSSYHVGVRESWERSYGPPTS